MGTGESFCSGAVLWRSLSLFSAPLGILLKFDVFQVEFWIRETQYQNELILECAYWDELSTTASVFEPRVDDGQGLESFQDACCGHLDMGTFSQHLQDREDQQRQHAEENQRFDLLLFAQEDRTNVKGSFEGPIAFFTLVLCFEMLQHLFSREWTIGDQQIPTVPSSTSA